MKTPQQRADSIKGPRGAESRITQIRYDVMKKKRKIEKLNISIASLYKEEGIIRDTWGMFGGKQKTKEGYYLPPPSPSEGLQEKQSATHE
jgi:hypothetical protein